MLAGMGQFQLRDGERYTWTGRRRGAVGVLTVTDRGRLVVGHIETGAEAITWPSKPSVAIVRPAGRQMAGMRGLENAMVVRIESPGGPVVEMAVIESLAQELARWAVS